APVMIATLFSRRIAMPRFTTKPARPRSIAAPRRVWNARPRKPGADDGLGIAAGPGNPDVAQEGAHAGAAGRVRRDGERRPAVRRVGLALADGEAKANEGAAHRLISGEVAAADRRSVGGSARADEHLDGARLARGEEGHRVRAAARGEPYEGRAVFRDG